MKLNSTINYEIDAFEYQFTMGPTSDVPAPPIQIPPDVVERKAHREQIKKELAAIYLLTQPGQADMELLMKANSTEELLEGLIRERTICSPSILSSLPASEVIQLIDDKWKRREQHYEARDERLLKALTPNDTVIILGKDENYYGRRASVIMLSEDPPDPAKNIRGGIIAQVRVHGGTLDTGAKVTNELYLRDLRVTAAPELAGNNNLPSARGPRNKVILTPADPRRR